MAWNGNSPGFASWNAVTSGTNPLQLSTNTGLYNYTTATSNYATTASNTLQTEINAIVTGGTTSLWANYPAISSFSMQGNNILDAKYISTLDLQVSSINGADINLFGSTVNVGGITITGGTINTTNITNNPAKGGGGGGGNNPTTGGSGNSTWSMINSAVGATMDTVSKTQQAISGVLNNTGAVLFQTYYAVETAGAIIDLANGAVQLATNAQALYDTREQNLISGAGVPGQTSYVYETINGTTQFQFSTLGAPVYTVFRTTDQQNPNQTFGREIFTSTIIPAGSKVVRSVSDPYQFNIISTCLLSTTNYMQSFGQWHAILEPDYNLYASSIKADSISTLSLSTGSAYINSGVFGGISSLTLSTGRTFISSINGQPISAFLNTGDATFNSLSTNSISTAQITTSSLIVKGGLTFSTLSGYDITRTLISTATLYDSVSSVTQNFLNYQMTLTSSPESFDMGSFFVITAGNEAFWSHKQLDFSQTTGQGVVDIQYGSYTNGDYFDLKNIGSVNVFVYYTFETNNLLLLSAPGTFYRLTYSSSTNNWTFAANPTQTTQTTNNTFQITQGWNTTTLSTNNLLVMKASEIIIPGALTAQAGFINNITSQNAFISSIFVNTATISSLIVSTSYTQNLIDTTISTTIGIFDTINVSSFYNGYASISSANVSSLTTNGIVFTNPPNKPYDLTNTFTSTVAGGYDNVSSLKQNILDYNFSANLTGEPIIYLGASFTCKNNDGSWASQYMIANSFSEVFLYTANATNYFDIQNKATTDIVTIYLSINGNLTTFLRLTPGTPIYRVTATVTAGVTIWTYAVSPGVTTPSFVQNNLTISQDLQKVYFSSMNTIQFNAGDIYMNGSLEATTAIFNNTTIQQAFISSISTVSLFAGNTTTNSLTANSLTTGSLTMTNGLTIPYLSTVNISTSFLQGDNLIAFTRVTTPSLSTVKTFNGFNARPIQNPGNILVYESAPQTFGNGLCVKDIDLTNFVPGVYECQAFCYNNPFRCLNATLFYNAPGQLQMYSANAFDNYNGCLWTTATVNLYPTARFQNQTDGGGDTFALFILMISGRTPALGDDPPFPEPSTITISTATVNYGTPTPIIIGLSSMIGSTITFQATENFSILADFPPPTYISSGSITVAGTNQVSLLANIVAIGGQTDVDIQANTNNVNIVANSTITLQGTPFDNFQGAIITSTPTYYVSNTQITNTSLVFLTPASPIDKPYWVTYDPGTDFCINVSSLATPTVMNYWVASYSGYGLQLSAGSVVATGGTVTTISGRRFHTFTTNGSFVLSSTPGTTIEIMIIGGGGGGGGWNAGGGGAGNLIVFQYVLTVGSYAVTLGAGGLGGIQSLSIGSQGSSTTFDVLATALGGGGGGTVFTGGGGNGGCGGGGSEVSPYDVAGSGITGTASGTVVQNLATSGGAGTNAGSQGGGGGGGCTVAGSTNSGGSGGAGGDGYTYYGSVYGGGGGGGAGAVGGSGGASGSGGGGAGSGVGISPGIDGTANTGGGGGGVNFGTGGAGGSGICIVSYTYP